MARAHDARYACNRCRNVPRRKNAVPELSRGRATRQAAADILDRRARIVAEIARLRARGEPSRFVENAQQLLTRWWATASWSGREELLKSAGWMLQLAERETAEPAPSRAL